MKLQQRYALAFLLVATAPLASCDYQNGPGKEPQYSENLNLEAAKPVTSNEVARDSVNDVQNVQPPLGKGSAADIQMSTDKALNSAPSGNAATSPQTVSGQPAMIERDYDGNSKNAKQAPSEASSTVQGNKGTTSGAGMGTGSTTQQ